jgi:uncharacterized membrane protein YdjX (TVP38/TMEM64 family)
VADRCVTMATRTRNLVRLALLIGMALALYWFIRVFDARHLLRVILEHISELGPWAPFWFVVAYVVACIVFFPGVILTLGAGILFSIPMGTILVSIGAALGAGCAFLISRYAARNWVVRKFSSNPLFQAVDGAVERDGWKIVGLIRLSPAFPFIPLNFVFGLTKIPFWQFFFVTWAGILPSCALFVYLGSLIGDLAELGARPIASGNSKWIVSGIGLASAVVVSILVTRIARRSLAEAAAIRRTHAQSEPTDSGTVNSIPEHGG